MSASVFMIKTFYNIWCCWCLLVQVKPPFLLHTASGHAVGLISCHIILLCCLQFDDEEMIPRKETEIVELSGGGDWHMAYLLLYKAIRVQG